MSSSNPFPHLISPPSLIFGHERDHEFFLHHHHDLLSSYFLPANAPAIDNFQAAFANHDVNRPLGSHCDSLDFLPKKKLPVKKDRHSKICTAQGPRARRVRLSIEIARKFFDLQDMLGFDKASKTLDWLFTKSKTAIEELAQKSLSSTSECEVISSGTNELAANNGHISKKKKKKKNTPLMTTRVNKEKKMRKQAHNYSFQDLLVRQSRAEARARARERTREKLCVRKFNELKNQSSTWNQIEPWEKFCYEQNLINISKPVSSNNNNYYFNITGNWDISGTTIQANRSSEFCGSKPWDVDNHQISHD